MTSIDCATIAARLMQTAAELGPDELRILSLVTERLRTGQRRYGRFDLADDHRDFRQESLEEVADALVYAGCALLRGAA
jgi:hypothetical protein